MPETAWKGGVMPLMHKDQADGFSLARSRKHTFGNSIRFVVNVAIARPWTASP